MFKCTFQEGTETFCHKCLIPLLFKTKQLGHHDGSNSARVRFLTNQKALFPRKFTYKKHAQVVTTGRNEKCSLCFQSF